MRILKILLLLPVLAYAAAWGYLWYEVKHNADEAISMAAPFAQISYGSVHVGLQGDEVGLNEVVIRPSMTNDEIRIKSLRLSAPHIGYFIAAGSQLKKGELPEKIGMQIDGLHLDLGSELFAMLAGMQQPAARAPSSSLDTLANLDALGCGQIKAFSLYDYRQMGMREVLLDVGFEFQYDKRSGMAQLALNANADGLSSIEIRSEFESGSSIASTVAQQGIPKASLNYLDRGYYKLRNAYCAGMNGGTEEAYVEQHIAQMSEALGVVFPDDALTAYRQLMLKGGSLALSMTPSSSVDPAGLRFYSLEDIAHIMGVALIINGHRLELNQVVWHGDKTRSTETQRAQSAPRTPSERPKPSRTAPHTAESPAPATTTTTTIRVAEAGKHLNRMVEVTTDDGRVRSGRLESVTAERLYLIIKLSSGTLSYPLETKKITYLRLLD